MIARVRGELVAMDLDSVVIDNGGIGFRVFSAESLIGRFGTIGEEVSCHTRLVVRENEISLYGFPTPEQCQLFDLLQMVTGIGPKVACNILGSLDPDAFALAILNGDVKRLTQAKGVGKKGAERLILELRDRLKGAEWVAATSKQEALAAADPQQADAGLRGDLLSALVVLGYSAGDAEQMMEKSFDPQQDLEANLRLALRQALK